jgi:PAS domain S-box-containing protein
MSAGHDSKTPTSLQAALQKLELSESRLAEAQEVAHIGSWEWTVGDNREWWSDELYRICGYEPNSLSPTFDTFARMLHPDDSERVAALIQQAFKDRLPFNFEHRIVRPSGECRTLMARCHVVVNEAGVVVRMVGTAQDITEWKQLQEELQHAQKMEAVGRLADGIAHEFNNLLTIIGGYTHAALSKIDEHAAIAHDLHQVRNASASAAALTRQLLMLRGPQSGQRVPVDVNALISGLEGLLRRTLGEQIQIITSLPNRVNPVLGDAGQLRQAIMNLAVNARDAMPRGGTLTIETRTVEPPLHDLVEVIVSDTGRGMDAATQAHIFEPMFTTKAAGQRSGFGLSTVYGIVQSLGGTIAVDSAPGRGTAFTIRLRSAPKTQAIEAASERPSSATSGGTETILLVEDDQSVRELTARLLREAGYRVLEAPSSRRALALVKDTAIQVDLLLIDVMLPGLNGVELFDVLRGSRRHARVLYMTGYSDQAISRAGAAIDNGALLTKPFTPNGLLQRIRDVLDKTAAS